MCIRDRCTAYPYNVTHSYWSPTTRGIGCSWWGNISITRNGRMRTTPVSYTHLDVYKRQALMSCERFPLGTRTYSAVFDPGCCTPGVTAVACCFPCTSGNYMLVSQNIVRLRVLKNLCLEKWAFIQVWAKIRHFFILDTETFLTLCSAKILSRQKERKWFLESEYIFNWESC